MDFNSDILIILLEHLLFSKLNCLLFNCISFLHLVVNFFHLLYSFSSTVLQVHFNNQWPCKKKKKRELGGWRACLLCKSTWKWAFATKGDEWKLMRIFFGTEELWERYTFYKRWSSWYPWRTSYFTYAGFIPSTVEEQFSVELILCHLRAWHPWESRMEAE